MTKALDTQVGGSHYKDFKIQPIEFIQKNDIGFVEGNIIKYICRWRAKGGMEDLKKVQHYVELLMELNAEEETDGVTFYRNGKPVSKAEFNADFLTSSDPVVHPYAPKKRLNDEPSSSWDAMRALTKVGMPS